MLIAGQSKSNCFLGSLKHLEQFSKDFWFKKPNKILPSTTFLLLYFTRNLIHMFLIHFKSSKCCFVRTIWCPRFSELCKPLFLETGYCVLPEVWVLVEMPNQVSVGSTESFLFLSTNAKQNQTPEASWDYSHFIMTRFFSSI